MDSGTLTDSLTETLALFDGSGEPRTTTEIAEELDLGRRSTYDRLERLVDRNRLLTKKVGANARVWWRPRGHTPTASPDWPRAAESLIDDVLDDVAVGVFVLDDEFDVAWVNETVETYFGLDRETVLGRDKRALVTGRIAPSIEDADAFAETVLATYDDNTYTERFGCHVEGGDGREERWLEHRSKPIESGEYAGGRVELYYDITDRKRSEREHHTDRVEFESLVEAVDEYAILTLDTDGYVRSWNAGARRIEGYEADEIVGEHFSAFYTEEDRAAGAPERNLTEAAKRGSTEEEGWRVRADGSRFWASVTITAVRDDDGDLEGFAKVTRDMTERRESERRLRHERDFNRQVLETAPASIFVLDASGDVVTSNDQFDEKLGVEGEEPLSVSDLALYDEAGQFVPPAERPYVQALESGEPVSDWKCEIELPDGTRRWVSLNVAPITDGGEVMRVVVAAQDVTQMHRQGRRLERQRDELQDELDDVFARIDDAFFALDADWRFAYVNEHAEAVLDRAAEELVGRSIWEGFPEATDSTFEEEYRRAMESQESVSFEEYYAPLETWLEVNAYPSEQGLSVYFRDVTDRVEREQVLERYETIVETVDDGVYALDADENFVMVNDAFLEMTGYDREELLGKPGKVVHSDAVNEAAAEEVESVARGDQRDAVMEFDLVAKDGERIPVESRFGPYVYEGERFGRCGIVRDISVRKEYERYLEDAKAQLEAATEAGAVGTFEWHVQEDVMITGPSLAKTFGIDPVAAREGVSLDRFVERIHPEDRERVERAIQSALEARGSYEEEYRAKNADGEYRWVIARGEIECDEDGTPVSFPGALTDISERKVAELELARQRERLAALNSLNTVVREITDAIIEQSTREEIEATVCDHLARSESYAYAWTGDVDSHSETVNVRTEAGVEGYLDDLTITVDPDDERSAGPTGRALRTGEIQVTDDMSTDSRHDPWREHVEEYGFQSSAAVPIVHEDAVYGVLNVYADRPDAFTGEEREVIAQLGELVGHAIAAAERKRALMSDELTELEFRIDDVLSAVGADADTDGRITLDHAVPLGDDEFLVYGTATADATDAVEAIVAALPHWTSVRFHTDDDPASFEVRMDDPPVLSSVASLGGYVDEAVVEDGDYRMSLHLAPNVDVRRVIDAVEEAYPTGEMVRRRQIQRSAADREREPRSLVADLTDRQRTTLEAAYHAGFFEWPRNTSGEEVAQSIGVAPPTFHQHLRKAEGKVFEALLATPS